MLKDDQVLAQLMFDKDLNVTAASKWSDEDIQEMMTTYLKTKLIASETKNNSLYLIINEKISQLNLAIKLKTKANSHNQASYEQPSI